MKNTNDVLFEVLQERQRQEQLRANGKFAFTCAAVDVMDHLKLPVLSAQTGEVAWELCCLNEAKTMEAIAAARARLRAELIQLGAVAVAWAESLPENPVV